jgi:hypothetical protein
MIHESVMHVFIERPVHQLFESEKAARLVLAAFSNPSARQEISETNPASGNIACCFKKECRSGTGSLS